MKTFFSCYLLLLLVHCKKPEPKFVKHWILNDKGTKLTSGTRPETLPPGTEVELALAASGDPECQNVSGQKFCKITTKDNTGWVAFEDLSKTQPAVYYVRIAIETEDPAERIPANTRVWAAASDGEAYTPLPKKKMLAFFFSGQQRFAWHGLLSPTPGDKTLLAGTHRINSDAASFVGAYRISTYTEGIPSTLDLRADGTFELVQNLCEGMKPLTGKYSVEGGRLILATTEFKYPNTGRIFLEASGPNDLVILNDMGCNPRLGDIFARLK